MQKLSFIKGLLIAGVFSSMFWIGAYYVLTSDSTIQAPEEIHTQQEIQQPIKDKEVVATKASL